MQFLIRGHQHHHRLHARQMEEVGLQIVCLKSSTFLSNLIAAAPLHRKPACLRILCMRTRSHNPTLPALKVHHDIHSSSPTAITSRRRATKYVPRVSSCSPASIGIVRTALSITTKKQMLHTDITDTYIKTHSIVAPCTHPGMKRIFRL